MGLAFQRRKSVIVRLTAKETDMRALPWLTPRMRRNLGYRGTTISNRWMNTHIVQGSALHQLNAIVIPDKKAKPNICFYEKPTLECKLVQPLWRTVWRFPKKVRIELPHDPAIPLQGIYLEKMKTLISSLISNDQKDKCPPMFTAALFTTAKAWKLPKCPSTEEWIKKMWHIYIYTNIYI